MPGDLLIASCVDTAAMSACDPPITAIDLHPHELWRAAARRLAHLLEGQAHDGSQQLIATTLRIRASSSRSSTGSSGV